jgi:ABC-type dipeptide/oligopeptide/nickel transport system permease component
MLRAQGASLKAQRVLMLPNLGVELVSSLDKMLVGLLTATMFAEPILGQSGIGSLALRAVRRSDVDLILGIVLVTAVTVGACRGLSYAVRSHYGVVAS